MSTSSSEAEEIDLQPPSDLEDSGSDEGEAPELRAAEESRIKLWRLAEPHPPIEADYDSDTSDEETLNTVGNIPMEWY